MLAPAKLARVALLFIALFADLACGTQGARAQGGPVDCPPESKPLSAEMFAASRAQARDRGFLWRVTRDGHSSYLYGTLHVGRDTWLAAGPAMASALQNASTLALELDPLDPDNARRMGVALAQAPSWPLAPDLRQRLVRQLQMQCLPVNSVGTSPSELLLAGVALALARRDGFDAQFGSETYLAVFARQRGMPVVSLETVELQLQALLSTNETEATGMLEDGLRELEAGTARQSLRDLVRMWEVGDQQRLETYEQWCECVVTPMEKLQMQRLLDQRNPAMAQQIDAMHRAGQRVFAAVGSLHMTGDRGLPAVLGRMGYQVERLP